MRLLGIARDRSGWDRWSRIGLPGGVACRPGWVSRVVDREARRRSGRLLPGAGAGERDAGRRGVVGRGGLLPERAGGARELGRRVGRVRSGLAGRSTRCGWIGYSAGGIRESDEALGRVVSRRVPGFDLTFSAPKSVSVLFGIGDDALRGAIQDAHDRAVVDALAYVEREAGVTRRGAGGAVVIAGRGLIGAAFRHRTSRAGDPQLHTHVLVANLVLGYGWALGDARRAPDLRAREDGRIPLRAQVAGTADAWARGGVGAGAQRDRRRGRGLSGGAAGVQPAAG